MCIRDSWSTSDAEILKTDPISLWKRSLHYRMHLAHRRYKSSYAGLFPDNGMNPGLISSFAMKGLVDVAKHRGILDIPSNYAELAYKLGLRTIHISERDTQQLAAPLSYDFINTWSCEGFISEALDPVQIGFGTHESEVYNGTPDSVHGTLPVEGPQNMRFFPHRGMDTMTKSAVPDGRGSAEEILGYVIPHGEANTLSQALTYISDGIEYRPSVYYVYKPSTFADESIKKLKEKIQKRQPLEYTEHVVNANELTIGDEFEDRVGALLIFESGDIWWSGTILSTAEVKKLGFKISGPTTVQVAACLSAIMKLSKYTHGFKKPEHFDYTRVLEIAKPYLGKIISEPVNVAVSKYFEPIYNS